MKYLVFILPQARRDIERNSDWWAEHHSLDEAIRWSDTIYVLAVRRGSQDVLRPGDVELQ